MLEQEQVQLDFSQPMYIRCGCFTGQSDNGGG
jgi:hypothetical protein